LQGHIGSGTYGDVCKAIDLEFNQIIALKVQIILSCLLFELGFFRCKKKKNAYMVMPGFWMGKKAFASTGLILTETKKFFYLVHRG
jgi:hypothetical protein